MALANNPPNISFRRNLVGPKLAWQNLIDRLTNVQLRDISMCSNGISIKPASFLYAQRTMRLSI
jgi:hypothetical protein